MNTTDTQTPQKTLREWLPREALSSYPDADFLRHLDQPVVQEFSGLNGAMRPWPGTHKNVVCWCVLANGRAVGWNENLARGWSFPVLRYRQTSGR